MVHQCRTLACFATRPLTAERLMTAFLKPLNTLGAAAVANGLKRAKSLSHDGRLTIPAAIGGEDLLRSVSTQGQSLQDSSSDAQSSTGGRLSIPTFPHPGSSSPRLAFVALCNTRPRG